MGNVDTTRAPAMIRFAPSASPFGSSVLMAMMDQLQGKKVCSTLDCL